MLPTSYSEPWGEPRCLRCSPSSSKGRRGVSKASWASGDVEDFIQIFFFRKAGIGFRPGLFLC